MLSLKKISNSWRLLVNAGSTKWTSAQNGKYHRIANRLLLAIVFINLWLNFIEIIAFVWLMSHDANTYRRYLAAYAIPSLVLYFFTGITFYLKNRTGNMKFAFLIVPVVIAYILFLDIALGKSLMIYLFLFALIPIPLFIHDPSEWKTVVFHELTIFTGIFLSFFLSEKIAPLYPLPKDLEKIFVSLAVMTAVFVMLLTATIMWLQNSATMRKLAIEKDHVEELLEETIPKLERAEEKYRKLVEGTNDIVFSMKPTGEFITVNKAIKTQLGFTPEEIQGKSIFQLFPDETQTKYELERELLHENIQELLRSKRPITCRVVFAGKYAREPVEFSLRLELAESGSETEILGKAISVQDDLIINFLRRERGSYAIGNFISHADILSQKLTRNLTKAIDPADVQSIRVSLREMLINAIEHGNLAVTFEEKTEAQASGDYLEFLSKRRSDEPYTARKVRIDYLMDAGRVAYRISDEGEGFDHANLSMDSLDTANENFLAHGRGINMARHIFDTVRYNRKGNEVVLIKNIRVTQDIQPTFEPL
ncbi:MAG: hypothetical protein LDLANPLL_01563 [Turneriella sp.]|nr:hypothetical protein [Turneriella sp.]